MKKTVFALLLLANMAAAQEITKNLGDFTSVRVYDKIEALLVKGNENKIVIRGEGAEDVEIVTKNDELKVRMKLTKMLQGEDVSVTLYYKNINEVVATEGAYVSSQDIFKSNSFEVSAKEGGRVKLNLDVQKLETDLNTAGIAVLTGTAASHEANITSGGILSARNLVTTQATVTIKAGGEADVNATKLVDAKTFAGGNINIYGKPATVNKKETAGGKITVRD